MRRGLRARLVRGGVLAAVWLGILALGLVGTESYIHRTQPNPYFFELDRLKVYNRKFYEQKREYFHNWPTPLELFDAEKATPRYLFKPNLRMALRGSTLEIARPGETVYRSSNSWGFRGPEFSVRKPPGIIRIVCLGASTTEGSQGDLETYPHFLQHLLEERYPQQRFEVLNAGYHGQVAEDLLAILREKVLPVDPDIVIFYEASNDLALTEFSQLDLSCRPNTCLVKAYQGALTLLRQRSAAFRRLAQGLGLPPPPERPLWHRFDDSTPKPAAVRYRTALRQIVRETLDHDSRIVLASFVTIAHDGLTVRREDNPLLFDHLYQTRYPFTPGELERAYAYYNRIIHDVAREFGVPFVDAASEFPRDVKYFPFDIIHFSPEGNMILASIFAKHLKERILPEFVRLRS